MKNFFIKERQQNRGKIYTLIGVIFWLLIWEIAALISDNNLLVPSIGDTIVALSQLVQESEFYLNCLVTLGRCFLAIIISTLLGVIFAWLAYSSDMVRNILKLPVNFFKTVPVMAIIIYFIILVESGWVPVLVSFLMCFPVMYTNMLSGLDGTDIKLLEVAQSFRLTTGQTMRYVYVPSSKASFESALRLISGLSWKAIVAAEVLAIPARSLGYQMMNAKYYLDTPKLFAYTLVIIGLSLLMEFVLIKILDFKEWKEYDHSKLSMVNSNSKEQVNSYDVSFDKVSKGYGSKHVLDDFSADIKIGQHVGIVGHSGIGKTTVSRMINGFDKPDFGSVTRDENLQISNLFQEDRLLPWLNVYDNIALGIINKGLSVNDERIFDVAKSLEIEDVLWKLPSQLSGGMQHRVALGRTYISDGDLFVLDEPFRGLDEDLKDRIINRIWKGKLKDKTVVLISHNAEDINRLCDIIINLEKNG